MVTVSGTETTCVALDFGPLVVLAPEGTSTVITRHEPVAVDGVFLAVLGSRHDDKVGEIVVTSVVVPVVHLLTRVKVSTKSQFHNESVDVDIPRRPRSRVIRAVHNWVSS
jgi:hypothetical protein